jgi:hypothetical protein
MAKVDISVTRSFTVNTGNYESVKPTVTMTVRDVDPLNVSDVYLSLEGAVSGLIKLEVLACAGEMTKISEGLKQYCSVVYQHQAEIGKSIEENLEELNKY